MGQAKLEHDWEIASHLMAMTANTTPGIKKPFKPEDLNPYRIAKGGKQKDDVIIPGDISCLKQLIGK